MKDINLSDGSYPYGLTPFGNVLYFDAMDDQHGTELWRSDGTVDGTYLVKDINPGLLSSQPTWLTASGAYLYFGADDGTNSGLGAYGLWRTDGTEAGTIKLFDRANFNPTGLIDVNGVLYFSAESLHTDGIPVPALWKSDGTPAGTVVVKEFDGNMFPGAPQPVAALGSMLFFMATTLDSGNELWKSDGTAAGTLLVKDLNPGAANSILGLTAVSQGKLYFSATIDPNDGLWQTDGTDSNTTLIKQFPLANCQYDTITCITQMTPVDNKLYFRVNAGIGSELWKNDGTTAGTTLVKQIPSDSERFNTYNLTDFNHNLYFSAVDPQLGEGVWKSDGAEQGTVLVKALSSNGSTFASRRFTAIDKYLYFATTINNSGLWRTDGTKDGTVRISDLTPNRSGGDQVQLKSAGDKLYFVHDDIRYGPELWALTVERTPKAQNDAYTTAEDKLLAVSAPGILANDNGNSPLTTTLKTNVTHGSLTLHADGSFVYSPTANFNGVDSFTYIVSNGVLSDTGSVNITVTPVNDDPVAVADHSTVMAGQAVTITVLTNDSDLDGDNLVIASVTQPTHGLVAIKGNTLVYTPTTNFTGADSFIYTISDGNGGSASATVAVNVTSNLTGDDDGDGLLNSVECPAGAACPDHDGDGIPDYQDIDSDGDGIPDATESKAANGVDAAESAVAPVDTDSDGVPDYLDTDSDNDSVSDAIEGHDANRDGIADLKPTNQDADKDGLDNVYDTVTAPAAGNATGAKVSLIDVDNDQLVNYRDADDNGDGIPTSQELGADPLHPIDSNGNGIPDYLEAKSSTNKSLFLPLVRR
ncbi:MAG: ELWxxDGT repeat protein [Caldilineaceae bacterium]